MSRCKHGEKREIGERKELTTCDSLASCRRMYCLWDRELDCHISIGCCLYTKVGNSLTRPGSHDHRSVRDAGVSVSFGLSFFPPIKMFAGNEKHIQAFCVYKSQRTHGQLSSEVHKIRRPLTTGSELIPGPSRILSINRTQPTS